MEAHSYCLKYIAPLGVDKTTLPEGYGRYWGYENGVDDEDGIIALTQLGNEEYESIVDQYAYPEYSGVAKVGYQTKPQFHTDSETLINALTLLLPKQVTKMVLTDFILAGFTAAEVAQAKKFHPLLKDYSDSHIQSQMSRIKRELIDKDFKF
ncbi:MAG: hypothetical protein VX100_02555 [Pseudomonadota bacterium]|nr:hypothetical protein [Pseudomonadota bacterium]